MKLNSEEIQAVIDYLKKKDVNYIDLHLEVLDHISSDVENKMEEGQLSFNEAFETVKLKWRKSFVKKSSLWLGISNSGPRIFINKCEKIYSSLWYKFLFLVLLFGTLFYGVNNALNYSLVNYEKYVSIIISIGLVLYMVLILYWYKKLKTQKLKTTYSYLYSKTIIPNLFSVLILIPYHYSRYITKDNKLDFIMITMLFVFFLTCVAAKFFYQQHLKTVSNYKKYQLK